MSLDKIKSIVSDVIPNIIHTFLKEDGHPYCFISTVDGQKACVLGINYCPLSATCINKNCWPKNKKYGEFEKPDWKLIITGGEITIYCENYNNGEDDI